MYFSVLISPTVLIGVLGLRFFEDDFHKIYWVVSTVRDRTKLCAIASRIYRISFSRGSSFSRSLFSRGSSFSRSLFSRGSSFSRFRFLGALRFRGLRFLGGRRFREVFGLRFLVTRSREAIHDKQVTPV